MGRQPNQLLHHCGFDHFGLGLDGVHLVAGTDAEVAGLLRAGAPRRLVGTGVEFDGREEAGPEDLAFGFVLAECGGDDLFLSVWQWGRVAWRWNEWPDADRLGCFFCGCYGGGHTTVGLVQGLMGPPRWEKLQPRSGLL